jgi:NitT/TauT family transport system substrate-binding protein
LSQCRWHKQGYGRLSKGSNDFSRTAGLANQIRFCVKLTASRSEFIQSSSNQESLMRVPGTVFTFAAAIALAAALTMAPATTASAQTKLTMGKVIGGDGFHIPTYVALDEGFFKAEGLDATLVELPASSIVSAVISGNLDCAPIPSGGAQAALSGAKIMYIVGESLKSQWTLTARQDIGKPEDLKDKTLGFGRPGGADYDEAQAVLHRFFQMDAGRDYKVISFQGEPERIAAMVNNDIQGALLSIPHAVVAATTGLKILLRTGDYIPRAGGTIWCMQSLVEQHPDTAKKIIRAIAKAVMYFRTNKEGSMKVMEHHIGSIKSDQDAGLIWDQLHESFGAEIPPDLFREILESRRLTMIAARQWPADKPLPDSEQFLARPLLESTLKEMNYAPTTIAPPAKSN